MSVGYSAFTVKANGIANSLKTQIWIKSENDSCEVDALWDTGATGSCISEEVAKRLGLVSTGMCAIKTPSGTLDVAMYLVDIQLPNNVLLKDVVVMESKIGDQGLGALIGMNIINAGDFAVTNHNGKTVFSYVIPSMKSIDFVPMALTQNQVGLSHKKKTKH